MPLGRQRTAPTLAYSPGNFASPGEVFLLLPSGKLFRAKKGSLRGSPYQQERQKPAPLTRVGPVSPLCPSEETKPAPPPCAVLSRVSPVSVGRDKTGINPLRRMQNVSCEPWTLYPSENPSSKLGYFQAATSSPYRVLHPAQGDKQKKTNLVLRNKNPFLRDKKPLRSVAVMLYTIPFLRWIHLLCCSTHRLFLLFIALQRMGAFCKKVLAGFRFGR